ncbi:MAG: hypothetical protein ACT4PS_06735 [Betaproteobacteria bacterium]
MGTVLIHFLVGTLASLVVFLVFTWFSGVRRFSIPFGVVFIGIACGAMAHFLSPWATPVIVAIYALASAGEFVQDRKSRKSEHDLAAKNR